MKMKFTFPLLCCIVAICACSKYETQYDGPYNDAENTNRVIKPHEILVAQNGNVYLYNRELSAAKLLEGTPPNVEKASINYSHDLVACWAPGHDLVVLDTNGVMQATIANSSEVDWFDWHSNNQTLVMLQDGIISLYGPSVEVADTDLNDVFSSSSTAREISCATVRPDGAVAFVYRYIYLGSYFQKFRIKYPPGSGSSSETYTFDDDIQVTWMRSNEDGNHQAFGNNDPSSPKTYRYSTYSDDINSWGSLSLYAFSPDEWENIYIEDQRLEYYEDSEYSFHLGNDVVTALDW